MIDHALETEYTYDPQDWQAFGEIAHQMVDDTLRMLQNLPSAPAWRPMPDDVRERLSSETVPMNGEGIEAAYDAFVRDVRPYPNGTLHPRFWGWVQGNGTPLGMMADMLASALNPHMAGFDQAPALVEAQVIRWLCEIMGFPAGAGGVLVTGGTSANLHGLLIARHAKGGYDVRDHGIEGPRLMIYCSSETHASVERAAEIIGLGRRSVRQIGVNNTFAIDTEALKRTIETDLSKGLRPICVVGTAGTINTGAFDDLEALANICDEHSLWLHVDGAFGAWTRLSESLRPLAAGIECADSLAFDLHKWGSLPFECACILTRDASLQRGAFSTRTPYLSATERGVIAAGLPFADMGIDLTRGFKALKAWLTFKAYGFETLRRLVEQNVDQAQDLGRMIERTPQLELLAPISLNVVCYRFIAPDLDETSTNALNTELLLRIQERGIAVPSSTVIDGNFALRVANVNHRSRRADFEQLVRASVEIGTDVLNSVKSL